MAYTTLSPEAFRSALAKGHGRALQAVRRDRILIDEDAVLDASLHNRAYDPQVEGSRGDWMYEILRAANATERFREPILSALKRTNETWALNQLCDLALFYARDGCEEARECLYQVFHTQPDSSAPWMAEEQIVRLDGLSGFLYLAKERGREFRLGEPDWDSDGPLDCAEEYLGAEQAKSALNEGAAGDPDLKAFQDGLREVQQRKERWKSNHRPIEDEMKAISVQQVLDEIHDHDPGRKRTWFRIWGRYASEQDLAKVLDAMFDEPHPGRLFKYIMTFVLRPMPHIDERFIELAEHDDPDVRERALYVLAKNTHPALRAFAVKCLEEGRGEGRTISLLAKNYQPGDHLVIEQALKPASDIEESHHIAQGLLDVFTENEDPDCLISMLFAYEESPCSACREKIVNLLLDLEILPDSLRDECRFDSNQDIRSLVADGTLKASQ